MFALVSGRLADDIDKINLNEAKVEELSKVPGLKAGGDKVKNSHISEEPGKNQDRIL